MPTSRKFGTGTTASRASRTRSASVQQPSGHPRHDGSGCGARRSPFGGGGGQRVEKQGTRASRTRKRSEAGGGQPEDGGVWKAKTVKRPPQHPAQPRHTNHRAPRTRKRHQQEHRPQRPTESSDPTQHAKGRTGDCPGPRKETTTRRNVTRGPEGAVRVLAIRGGWGVGSGAPAMKAYVDLPKPLGGLRPDGKCLASESPAIHRPKMISASRGIVLAHICWGGVRPPPAPPLNPRFGGHCRRVGKGLGNACPLAVGGQGARIAPLPSSSPSPQPRPEATAVEHGTARGLRTDS